MKKKYEKNKLIIIICFIFFIIIFLFLLFIFNKKIVVYKNISGVVFSDNIVTFLVDDSELKLFSKNKVFYFCGKRKKIKIKEINKDVLKRNGKNYHYVYLEVKIPKTYTVNDMFNISIV